MKSSIKQNHQVKLSIKKGTVLYRGVNIDVDINSKGVSKWYANFEVAAHYAFGHNTPAGYGRILTYICKKDIHLLDLSNRFSLQYIYDKSDTEGKKLIKRQFGYPAIKRYSNSQNSQLTDMFCQMRMRGIHGFGYTEINGFHPELMICNPSRFLKKVKTEYRWLPFYKRNSLLEITNGQYTGVNIPINNIEFNAFGDGKKRKLKIKANPNINPSKSKFLLNTPIKPFWEQHLKKYKDYY